MFISQEGYARDILKRFGMEDSNPMNTPMEPKTKLSRNDEGVVIDENLYRSLVGSLRYLTCTRPDISYAVGVISRYMESPKSSHWKTAKRILRYVKGTTDLGLLYPRRTNTCVKLAVILTATGVKTRMIGGAQLGSCSTSGRQLSHGSRRSKRLSRCLHARPSMLQPRHV